MKYGTARPVLKTHRVTVNGVRVRFVQAGHGPPVLLVHGVGETAESWCDVLTGLAAHYRAIAVHLPGNGGSDPTACPAPDATAALLWRFLETLGVRRAALVGHSFGGAVTVHMALQRPADVPRLVLVSSIGLGRTIHPAQIIQAVTPLGELSLLAPRVPAGPHLLAAWLAQFGTDRPWRLPPTWWRSQTRVTSSPEAVAWSLRTQRFFTGPFGQRRSLLPDLRNLTMPTLVAWGVRDRVLPYRQALRASRHLPDARVALFPHAGHLLHTEAPDALLDVVLPFLHAPPRGRRRS